MAIISVTIDGHDTFSAPSAVVDDLTARILPASRRHLRDLVERRCGVSFDEIQHVATYLVILADFHQGSAPYA